MQAEPTDQVLFEKKGTIGIIRLNRPAVRNAISVEMAKAIEQYIKKCETDSEIRVGIVTGTGPVFCAGADLKEVAQGREAGLVRPDSGFAGFVYAAKAKPWIAAVQGPAHGGGTEIALACDMIVAGKDTHFALPEARRGLIAGASGAFRIARSLPRSIATEIVTTGNPRDAERAYDLGLVNRLVETDQVLTAAIALAEQVAACSPLSVREALVLTRRASRGDEQMFREMEADAVASVMSGPDCREGAQAFVEKREPVWKS